MIAKVLFYVLAFAGIFVFVTVIRCITYGLLGGTIFGLCLLAVIILFCTVLKMNEVYKEEE